MNLWTEEFNLRNRQTQFPNKYKTNAICKLFVSWLHLNALNAMNNFHTTVFDKQHPKFWERAKI